MLSIRRGIHNLYISIYNQCQPYSQSKEARCFQKIIMKGQKKLLRANQISLPTSLSDYARKTLYRPESRRMSVLNKVFMEQICDIMSTGEYSEKLDSHGIEIVKVKVAPSLNILYVYWIHTKSINESETNKFLISAASHLRYELSTVKVMGVIPEIRFAKHEDMIEQQNAEILLDHLAVLHCEKPRQIVENQYDKQEVAHNNELVLPPMVENVFGLDHTKIMNQVIMAKNKSNVTEIEKSDYERTQTEQKETLVFDKKALSKVLFNERYKLRKLQQENRRFSELITSKNEENEEDVYDDDDDFSFEYDIVEDFECGDHSKKDKGEEEYDKEYST